MTDTKDKFCDAHKLESQPSVLVIQSQFRFCGGCFAQGFEKHGKRCTDFSRGTDAYITAQVFKHNPPKQNGCHMLDKECAACQLSKATSPSFQLVRLCERDLGTSGDPCISGKEASYTCEQIAYQLEMCAEFFKVKCQLCKSEVSRADYEEHDCVK